MSRTWSHPNFYQAELIVAELIQGGAGMFFVAPGSRSSPLAMAVARLAARNAIVHFDERGLAFAAIGYARATRTPAVLICTSGTAVANFLPAVVEASMSAIPLIVLTADRPPELHDIGSNQTIPQREIFGAFVRFESELEVPSQGMQPSAVVETIVNALQRANRTPQGPVHINCPYREPLAPQKVDVSFSEQIGETNSLATRTAKVPSAEFDHTAIDWLTDMMKEASSGLIVVGRLDSGAEADAVAAFANATGWPVVADVTSQLRLSKRCPHLCEYFDLMLLSGRFVSTTKTDMVVHIGGEFVSKRLLEFFQNHRPNQYVHISNDPRRRDPAGCVIKKLTLDFSDLPRPPQMVADKSSQMEVLARHGSKIASHIGSRFDNEDAITEIGVARAIVENAPAHSVLFLSSSLPIRLVDMYAPAVDNSILVGANRGASGIDGVIASAVGFARGSCRATTLLIGDLALLHDLNSLAMIREASVPFVIVLINNDGGGIFHLLPIADSNPNFERFWGTPHGLKFSDIAASFGLNYIRSDTMETFKSGLKEGYASVIPTLIEICTSRDETAKLIRRMQSEIKSLLD
jgi:2-succinyl-5-enolpyruvyl-6-hydroxy-3-cyclohexene-1-carboxylate synthase